MKKFLFLFIVFGLLISNNVFADEITRKALIEENTEQIFLKIISPENKGEIIIGDSVELTSSTSFSVPVILIGQVFSGENNELLYRSEEIECKGNDKCLIGNWDTKGLNSGEYKIVVEDIKNNYKASIVVNLIEKVVTQDTMPTIVINAPKNNTTSLSNEALLSFETTGADLCWYDLGNPETKFDIPNCENIKVDFGYGQDIVLNVWVENEVGSIFDSTWFKTPNEQVEINITSPLDNLSFDTNIVNLDFETKGNPDLCWYDLGNLETFTLEDCQGKEIELEYGKDYTLNLYASKGEENVGQTSAWFKINPKILPIKKVRSSGSIAPQFIKSNIPNEIGQVLGADKYFFALDLKFGMRGNEVTELQKRLIADGYLKIVAPTGYFGPKTLKAVKDFQTANSLVADGIVGPKTREVLNK